MKWIIYGVLGYLVYYYIKKNRLSPEQKELKDFTQIKRGE